MGVPINPPNFARLHQQSVQSLEDRLDDLPAPILDVLDVKKLEDLIAQGKQDKDRRTGAQQSSMNVLRQIGWLNQWLGR